MEYVEVYEYVVSRKLLDGVEAFHRDSSACVKVKGEVGERFTIHGGVR